MGRLVGRWLVAGVVAVAVFAVTVWVAQVVVLPRWVAGEADRWVVSAAVATVLAGLVGVWADAWAKARDEGPGGIPTPSKESIRVEGGVDGIVSLGDRTVNRQHRQTAGVPAPTPLADRPAGPDVSGSASGADGSARPDRSVEVGRDVSGIVSIGDDASNTQLP